MITREQILERLHVDTEKGEVYWLQNHHAWVIGREASHPFSKGGKTGYHHVRWNGGWLKRAHIIFFIGHGRWPSKFTDHINGVRSDDRLCNLREATRFQNAWNQAPHSKKSPYPPGVRRSAYGQFEARITHKRKCRSLGTFPTVEEAADAYIKARSELFGDFARVENA
jgi:hypothetical protein